MGDDQKHTAPRSGIVTFLDVLGWKGVYDRQPDAIKTLTRLIEGVTGQAEKQRGRILNDVQIKSISDTIAIFAFCEEKEISTTLEIHGELCQWIIPASIDAEIPLRGATSYGEFEINSGGNIFVGKAIDEAASWHEQSDWIGVHLTPSAEYVYEPQSASKTWVSFCPPNKTRLNWKPHCVNWTIGMDGPGSVERIKSKFRRLGPIVPEIAAKFSNTLAFIEAVQSPPRPSLP